MEILRPLVSTRKRTLRRTVRFDKYLENGEREKEIERERESAAEKYVAVIVAHSTVLKWKTNM